MINTRNIQPRLLPAAAAVIFVALSWMNLRLIGSCLGSFGGSMALLVLHPENFSLLVNADTVQYWIAGLAWCAAPLFIGRKILSPLPGTFAPLPAAANIILATFIFIAVTAPIIAPLPPLAQGGSLHTDRFLPPLSRGCVVESISPAPLWSADAGIPERMLLSANQYLLHRTVVFSQSPETSGPAANAPSEAKRSSILFLFGTDAVGRDIFSRVVYGSRYSLGIGFAVVLISLSLGSAAGMIAGYAGGFVDGFVMRAIDVLFSIPPLILALTLMAFIGQSVAAMIIVLSAAGWMGVARLLRAEVLSLRRREFIFASQLLGTPHIRILRIHIFPNVLPTIKNAGILQLGNIILAEASMSFLGLGIQQPEPSWGNMIADSMTYAGSAPFTAIFPGIALSILIVSVHIIGGHPR